MKTTALLILLLMNGSGTAIVVDKDVCEQTVAVLQNGGVVNLEDDNGQMHEVEMAKCATEPETMRIPTS